MPLIGRMQSGRCDIVCTLQVAQTFLFIFFFYNDSKVTTGILTTEGGNALGM